LERRLVKENGFKIENHLLEFSGQCRQCRVGIGRKNITRERIEV
jgi:hypothetical protein